MSTQSLAGAGPLAGPSTTINSVSPIDPSQRSTTINPAPQDVTFSHRGGYGPDHHLIAPENRAPSALAGLKDTVVHKLVTPRRSPAAFSQCLLLIAPGGGSKAARRASATSLDGPGLEHFLYLLAGSVESELNGEPRILRPGEFQFLAPGAPLAFENVGESPAELLWISKRYVELAGFLPPQSGCGARVEAVEALFAPGVWRSELVGGSAEYDFMITTMRFEPGADLGIVEIHDEEHGLWMSAGGGIYLLGERRYPVAAGDFIYMAPYCPQGFVADPETGGEYLLYKDTYRGPLAPAGA